ncbi:heavy metal translocating P-type ATPase [Hoeflea sp. CAU 1731]
MSCCAAGSEASAELETMRAAGHSDAELRAASRPAGDGLKQLDLALPGVHCGGCIRTVEAGLSKLPFVNEARVNLSTRRVRVIWREDGAPSGIVNALQDLGYEAHIFDFSADKKDKTLGVLLRSLAVAGFAAANIMLLSVSVWSGADAATRDMFHWISALIAIPALAYSGQVFYRSAFAALRKGRLNMDVPITLAVILAFAMSLYETMHSGERVYFDASVTLMFFLLIGRTLDHVMREQARNAVAGLRKLAPGGASILNEDGGRTFIETEAIEPGMHVLLAAGDRVPVDGRVIVGESDMDASLVSGESAPLRISPGSLIQAGTLNLTGPLTIKATASAGDSFLAEMVRLMEAAEGGKARYRRIADRAAELYAPAVHLAALLAFVGWMVVSRDFGHALYIAIAVLIITCPCALGLAVPVVQVVAAGRLFKNGIMVKDGSAMERMAEADMAVFDKTGTLTMGEPVLVNAQDVDPHSLSIAAAIGRHSRHPLARALAGAAPQSENLEETLTGLREAPGKGVECVVDGRTYRLGRAEWALEEGEDEGAATSTTQAVLGVNGRFLAVFQFEDRLRPAAAETIATLKNRGIDVEILSGDRLGAVERLARLLGVATFRAGVLPSGKQDRIAALASEGWKVLMVGDGLNDAPALSRAHVSMAPATAADVGRNAADFVFLHSSLDAVAIALDTSVRAGNLIRQNFALAILYNLIAIPTAVLGFASPLVAAIAMSSSSIVVILNSLRLRLGSDRLVGVQKSFEPAEREVATTSGAGARV